MFIKPETMAFAKLFQTVIVTKPYPPSDLRLLNAQPFETFLEQAQTLKRTTYF